ncbi:MAG: protein kinase, partial [Gaiellales bacterium]
TLDYMAPEQLRQLDVSPATDVYALACVLFECLTGEVPFRSRRALALMFAHAEADRPPASERAPELPVAIDAVIARGMAQSPGARYASCGELVTEAWLALGSERAGESAERASGARRALPATEARNPYKGLRAFGEADAEDFHGREALSDELLERLGGRDRGRLVVVVGPSGSGKSSVVRAGVLPLVRRGAVPGSERWLIAELVPGALPVEELEAALLRLSFTR